MARPTKEGLDYFPIDIDFDQNDKLLVPVSKFGMLGLGVIVKLMAEIYRNGYFYPWGELEQNVFPNRVNVSNNTVIDIVNECIKWGFFNRKLYESHQILTSAGFQKRFIEASKRRKSIVFIDEYTLIDLSKACEKVAFPIVVVNVDGKEVNVYINPDKCSKVLAESTQSKVKESKVKEIKLKEIKDKNKEIFEAYTSNLNLIETLESFIEFRKKIKKPMTEKAITLLLGNLDKLASGDGEKVLILEQSILNGWQGVFELKNKGGMKNAGNGGNPESPYSGVDFGF